MRAGSFNARTVNIASFIVAVVLFGVLLADDLVDKNKGSQLYPARIDESMTLVHAWHVSYGRTVTVYAYSNVSTRPIKSTSLRLRGPSRPRPAWMRYSPADLEFSDAGNSVRLHARVKGSASPGTSPEFSFAFRERIGEFQLNSGEAEYRELTLEQFEASRANTLLVTRPIRPTFFVGNIVLVTIMWALIVFVVVVPLYAIARAIVYARETDRRHFKRCIHCNYDVAQSPGTCPECGRHPSLPT